MDHIVFPDGLTPATYALQMRRSPHGYIIAMGMRSMLDTFSRPITQSEVDFAEDFYANAANIPYFNKAMWQTIIDKYDGYIPIEVDSVPEGTALLPGDPLFRVTGPSELVAHFEPDFHRVFYPSLVATTAHEIHREFPGMFLEVGKRGAITEEDHLIATGAMLAGGNITLTSSDTASAVYPDLKDVGTMGHRYVQTVSIQEGMSEMDAFRKAIERCKVVYLLIDLVDSYRGIDIAIKLKEEYRNTDKFIAIRLDSGDVGAQTLYALKEYGKRGFLDPARDKVVVEGIDSIDDMRQIYTSVKENGFRPEDNVIFGAGGLLISKGTARSDGSSGLKVTEFGGNATMKWSNDAGKESIPGVPTVFNGRDGRVVGQAGERLGNDIFVPAYRYPGKVLLPEGPRAIFEHAKRSYAEIAHMIGKGRTPHSPATQAMEEAIRKHYS